MSDWSPTQYERFKDERSKPFFDLLALVQPRDAMRVVDLGCGTGELTRTMHRRLAARSTLGVDSSEAMLEKARALTLDEGEREALRFVRAPIESFAPESPVDLILSNAALHWVDDHEALLARLSTWLAPNGQLAVQIPANDDHPAYLAANEVAREPEFAQALGGYVRVFPNLSLSAYARTLDRLGFREQHVRMQVYGHHLGSREEVVEWVKGSLLTDYEKRLPKELFARFLARYRDAIVPRLPDERPFFYPFKRIFFWGQR